MFIPEWRFHGGTSHGRGLFRSYVSCHHACTTALHALLLMLLHLGADPCFKVLSRESTWLPAFIRGSSIGFAIGVCGRTRTKLISSRCCYGGSAFTPALIWCASYQTSQSRFWTQCPGQPCQTGAYATLQPPTELLTLSTSSTLAFPCLPFPCVPFPCLPLPMLAMLLCQTWQQRAAEDQYARLFSPSPFA